MAIPRNTRPVSVPFKSRRSSDFPSVVAATQKRDDIGQRLGAKQAELREFDQTNQLSAVESKAVAVMNGTEASTVTRKDIANDVAVLQRAFEMADAAVADETRRVAHEIAAEFAAEDQKRLAALVASAEAFLNAADSLEELRLQFRNVSGQPGAVSPMRDIALNKRSLNPLRHDLGILRDAVQTFRYGVN